MVQCDVRRHELEWLRGSHSPNHLQRGANRDVLQNRLDEGNAGVMCHQGFDADRAGAGKTGRRSGAKPPAAISGSWGRAVVRSSR